VQNRRIGVYAMKGREMRKQKAQPLRNIDSSSNVLVEVPVPLDPHSPRKRKFVCDVANLIVYYDYPDGDTITGIELCLANVHKGKSLVDIFISSDDYYKKFVVTPAEKTTCGMVRGRTAGYMSVDKTEVLDKVRICTPNLESNIADFLISRITKYMY
jgi:hypothetical protein